MKNATVVQLLSLTLILTLIFRADLSDKLERYIVEQYIVYKKISSIKERTQTSTDRLSTKFADAHFGA